MSKSSAAPIVPVVLSGGSGVRLWPRSSERLPKQFLRLVGERSLFQDTLTRASAVAAEVRPPVIVCNELHRELVLQQSREIGLAPEAIVLEPVGRNTAPAVAVAALLAKAAHPHEDPLLLVLASDHVILDAKAFAAAVGSAVRAAAVGYLVTFGVVPSGPETGFGYIRRGANRGDWALIDRFVEKPDLETAEEFLRTGLYLWNSGMFVFPTSALLDAMREHAPDLLQAADRAVRGGVRAGAELKLSEEFAQCASVSVDVAVMEKTNRAAVVPLSAGWSDVGSWSALHDVLAKDPAGNVVAGDVIAEACTNSYLVGTSRPVAAIGLDGIVVVESPDGVLVMSRDRAQQVKSVVEALKGRKR